MQRKHTMGVDLQQCRLNDRHACGQLALPRARLDRVLQSVHTLGSWPEPSALWPSHSQRYLMNEMHVNRP